MERKEAIRSAYHMTGSNSFYDGMMTCSTLPGRAVCLLVWDMNRQDCVRYQEKAVSGIPEDFAGRLLEVPVGTGSSRCRFTGRCRGRRSRVWTIRPT